jgi:hypothetical protein
MLHRLLCRASTNEYSGAIWKGYHTLKEAEDAWKAAVANGATGPTVPVSPSTSGDGGTFWVVVKGLCPGVYYGQSVFLAIVYAWQLKLFSEILLELHLEMCTILLWNVPLHWLKRTEYLLRGSCVEKSSFPVCLRSGFRSSAIQKWHAIGFSFFMAR